MIAFQLRPGILNRAALIVYTQQQCHALALALHDATGWQMFGDYPPDRDGVPSHIFVKHPSGDPIDIRSAFGQKPQLRGEQRPVSEAEVWRLVRSVRYAEPDLDLARSFVGPVLAQCQEVVGRA